MHVICMIKMTKSFGKIIFKCFTVLGRNEGIIVSRIKTNALSRLPTLFPRAHHRAKRGRGGCSYEDRVKGYEYLIDPPSFAIINISKPSHYCIILMFFCEVQIKVRQRRRFGSLSQNVVKTELTLLRDSE